MTALNLPELNEVTGGFDPGPQCYINELHCQDCTCRNIEIWSHIKRNLVGEYFDCPKCGKHTLLGTKLLEVG